MLENEIQAIKPMEEEQTRGSKQNDNKKKRYDVQMCWIYYTIYIYITQEVVKLLSYTNCL